MKTCSFQGVAVSQEVELSSTSRGVSSSIPGSFCPYVKVSLGKTLNPKLLPVDQASTCMAVLFLVYTGQA